MKTQLPLRIGSELIETADSFPVYDKFTGEEIARSSVADAEHVAAAAATSVEAMRSPLAPHERAAILGKASELIGECSDRLRDDFVAETGFTVREAEVEIRRTAETLRLSSEEARRVQGNIVPLAGAPGEENRLGFTLRVPVGPVCAITPFNSPLNTVAHKVAPAIAAGNSVVLKPASFTPLSADHLCSILAEAGLPAGWLNLLTGPGRSLGTMLSEEQRFRFYAFTGSTEAGLNIQASLGLRRSQMELGAISSTILCDDADVEAATPKLATASFRKAGQVCTSVQLVFAPTELAAECFEALAAQACGLRAGDPRDSDSALGPMISESEAERAERWVRAALSDGARASGPVERSGALLQPLALTDVTPEMNVTKREIFAPVVSVIPVRNLDEAIRRANESPYGLSVGVYTKDWRRALQAGRELEVGVVQIDETSSSRVDLMPYGGTKASGFGREGPRYAIEEMTEERLVVWNE